MGATTPNPNGQRHVLGHKSLASVRAVGASISGHPANGEHTFETWHQSPLGTRTWRSLGPASGSVIGGGLMRRISLALLLVFVFTIPWQTTIESLSRRVGYIAFVSGVLTCLAERRIAKPPAFVLAACAFVAWQLTTYF